MRCIKCLFAGHGVSKRFGSGSLLCALPWRLSRRMCWVGIHQPHYLSQVNLCCDCLADNSSDCDFPLTVITIVISWQRSGHQRRWPVGCLESSDQYHRHQCLAQHHRKWANRATATVTVSRNGVARIGDVLSGLLPKALQTTATCMRQQATRHVHASHQAAWLLCLSMQTSALPTLPGILSSVTRSQRGCKNRYQP